MARFDITKTDEAVERLLDVTKNPRHYFLLAAYDRHRKLEMAGRYAEIFVPEMIVEHPVYHLNAFGVNEILDGREAVEALYAQWTQTGQCVFYVGDERLK